MTPRLMRWPIRIGMRLAYRLRGFVWRHSTRPIRGVCAIVLTPEEKIVLVRHSYVPGWYLPAGGVGRGESEEVAIHRELREEIGLVTGAVEPLWQTGDPLGRHPHSLTTFVARGAVYRPRWSLEIEEIGEFDPAALPADLSPRSARALARFLQKPGDGAAP